MQKKIKFTHKKYRNIQYFDLISVQRGPLSTNIGLRST
jgi:hypothetical protein